MKHRIVLGMLLTGVAVHPGWAQGSLTPQQLHGRQIVTQNCVVCHLPSDPGAKTYGPPLNKAAANGDPKLMHQVIESGLVRMPGWKYALSGTDIDDVVSYILTIPVSAASAAQ